MENIQQYRQPLVTATGIFLGFMLKFVTEWMPISFVDNKIRDSIVAAGTLPSIALLVVVLYRILRLVEPERQLEFYKTTLHLFIIGISLPFFSMVVIMLRKLVLVLT
ncbi:MAG TPA: hypothetical protein VI385_09170 [Flavisolibacter sp.]